MTMRIESFENDAPTTASEAATIILDGVRAGDWRILIGADAHVIDLLSRSKPTAAHTEAFLDERSVIGHFGGLIQR